MSDFDEPGSYDNLSPADIVGHLLLIWAIEYIPSAPTTYNPEADAIAVDVVDLYQVDPNTNQPGLLARNTWWRPGRLIKALRPKVGAVKPMLVFMTQAEAVRGKPPYELISASNHQDSVDRANAWLRANPDFTPSKPAARRVSPQPRQQQQQWQQPAPQQQWQQQAPQAPVQFQPAQPRPQETELEKLARLSREGAVMLRQVREGRPVSSPPQSPPAAPGFPPPPPPPPVAGFEDVPPF